MSRSARLADIAAVAEYRAVLGAATLSWAGDMLAKAALTYLVFTQTDSVARGAATFARPAWPGRACPWPAWSAAGAWRES